ncbi:filamentous hemagglutinin N-terminal domain-containing protein [Azotobacter chroococcum]|uniref:two-partner secretion domain-containing protein n=1 Tax=Azotobacter chroococcum TaxID=353 RepID=UPI0010AEA95F|nr:filamentous hemagglutinin N-terminal domain-containing protein [Azotobacter chroococcum]TKD47272.1 filamentous hemagglutinin N-terminal domain-containing protein [Azotobacter chroococcum]
MIIRRPQGRSASPTGVGPFVLCPLALAIACLSGQVLALPEGGMVVGGSAQIGAPVNGSLTINQASNRAAIDWQGFSIGQDERVTFQQPSADAITLNRVVGNDPSEIMGSLNANGRVFLLNPNGVLFGAGSRVETGGMIASTLADVDQQAFMAGSERLVLSGSPGDPRVVNQGEIRVSGQGTVALIGPLVTNQGLLQADGGTAALVAANQVEIDFHGDGLTSFYLPEGALPSEVYGAENTPSGVIMADGGRVAMLASASSVASEVLNQEGYLRARSLEVRDGEIFLGGDYTDIARISGTLDARGGEGLSGGRIAIDGGTLHLNSSELDASGAAGGGQVLVHARQSATVAQDAKILANATQDGKGGDIKLQAGNSLSAHGSLEARGAGSGTGGYIETSALAVAVEGLQVRADAAAGQPAGTWLIGSTDITIAHDTGSFPDSELVVTTLYDSDINAALDGGSNITITSHDIDGNDKGNIHLKGADIHYSAEQGGRALRLEAQYIFGESSSIRSTGDALNVSFSSSRGIDFVEGKILSNGGAIDLSAQSSWFGLSLWDTVIDSRIGQSNDNPGGNVSLTSSVEDGDAIDLFDTQIDSGSGSQSIQGISSSGNGILMVSTGSGHVRSSSGSIRLSGQGQGDYLISTDSGTVFEDVAFGVNVDGYQIQSSSGEIDISGIGTTNIFSGGVQLVGESSITTTSGLIKVVGESKSELAGLLLERGSSLQTGGNVELQAGNDGSADSLVLDGQVSAGGSLNLRPLESSATIRLGGDVVSNDSPLAGGFYLSQAELNNLSATNTVIGSAEHAGLIEVAGPISYRGNLTLQNEGAGAGIQLAAPLTVDDGVLGLLSYGDVTQAPDAPIKSQSLLASSLEGDVLLGSAITGQHSGTIIGSAAGRFLYTGDGSLTIAPVSTAALSKTVYVSNGYGTGYFKQPSFNTRNMSELSAQEQVQVRTLAGDLGLQAGIHGGSVDLITAGVLRNTGNVNIDASDWRIWASTKEGEERGNLASADSSDLYGCTWGGACSEEAADELKQSPNNNYFIYSGPLPLGVKTVVPVIPGPGPKQVLPPAQDWLRELPDTGLYAQNLVSAQICLTPGLTSGQRLQEGDALASEWSRVKSRPKLNNCVPGEERNTCGDF